MQRKFSLKPTALTLACLVGPTLIFWLLSVEIFFDRGVVNVDYLVLGFLGPLFRHPVYLVLWILTLSIDLLVSASSIYLFEPLTFVRSIPYLGNISVIGARIALLVLVFVVLATGAATLGHLAHRSWSRAGVSILAVLGLILGIADIANGTNSVVSIQPSLGSISRNIASSPTLRLSKAAWRASQSAATRVEIAPAVSAVGNTIWASNPYRANPEIAGKHFVLIIVESWGASSDLSLTWQTASPLFGLTSSYDVRKGLVPFFSSTTFGELRELCGLRVNYSQIDMINTEVCLPSILSRKGFHVLGIHGFSDRFFDRYRWWPRIGISNTLFGQELLDRGLSQCGTIFRGICDNDVLKLMSDTLSNNTQRQFIYWLTLNTHLPVPVGAGESSNFRCREFSLSDTGQACGLSAMLHRLFEDIARLATSPDLAATHFVIVGDHAPPIVAPDERSIYLPDRVPYIELRPRAAEYRVDASF